jgi:hypothetical protein
MAAKPKAVRSKTGKSQAERFIEAARQIGADESGERFERAFDKITANSGSGPDASSSRQSSKKDRS